MKSPTLYDVFCGAGGATRGYQRAGFRVIGIDHEPQPHYCGDGFIRMDAFEFFARVSGGEYPQPDAWHCSPPCQGYSRMRHLPWLRDRDYPLLIEPTRRALEATGRPWVIENVADAPLPAAIILCGQPFGLKVYRHRKFEASVMLFAPPHLRHRIVLGKGRNLNDRAKPNADGWVCHVGKNGVGGAAMGIDWMTGEELSQAIPPAYTEWVGRQLLRALGVAA